MLDLLGRVLNFHCLLYFMLVSKSQGSNSASFHRGLGLTEGQPCTAVAWWIFLSETAILPPNVESHRVFFSSILKRQCQLSKYTFLMKWEKVLEFSVRRNWLLFVRSFLKKFRVQVWSYCSFQKLLYVLWVQNHHTPFNTLLNKFSTVIKSSKSP